MRFWRVSWWEDPSPFPIFAADSCSPSHVRVFLCVCHQPRRAERVTSPRVRRQHDSSTRHNGFVSCPLCRAAFWPPNALCPSPTHPPEAEWVLTLISIILFRPLSVSPCSLASGLSLPPFPSHIIKPAPLGPAQVVPTRPAHPSHRRSGRVSTGRVPVAAVKPSYPHFLCGLSSLHSGAARFRSNQPTNRPTDWQRKGRVIITFKLMVLVPLSFCEQTNPGRVRLSFCSSHPTSPVQPASTPRTNARTYTPFPPGMEPQ